MDLPAAAAGVAATTLAAMYLDARYLIRHDLNSGGMRAVFGAPLRFLEQRAKADQLTIFEDLLAHASSPTHSNNVFLIFEGREWTFKQFFDDTVKIANWLLQDFHVERGEIVTINGTNSPEYLMLWFALEAIGAHPAFLNCNLTAEPLIHCVQVVESRLMMADVDVQHLVEPVESRLKNQDQPVKVVYYSLGLADRLTDGRYSAPLPEARRRGWQLLGVCNLMYTSGTTGLPKAVIIHRARELSTADSVTNYLALKPGSRMYTCLPLYHGAAHGLAVTPTVHAGSTLVLSRKFSHKKFWQEVRDSQADTVQYVGELCRYLVNAPPDPLDQQHSVKMAWGNGMRPDVWEVFRNRFGIESINELYAATDGLGGSFNNNKNGFGKFAIGKRGLLWNLILGPNEKRVKIDVVTQEMLRDKDGFAIPAQDGEPGEAVHRLFPEKEKLQFAGYFNNAAAGDKRKVRDLFQKGDFWFRSGDVMRQDPDGCLYFVDRLGDTFRWKSENVSTNEVGDVIGHFDQIAEANVYGVLVPRADGRCGCAAVVMAPGVTEDTFDFARLAQHAIRTLPRYAVPIFVRVVKELEYTGTMKMQKGKLREQGINLDKISTENAGDSMYWLPPGQSVYVPFRPKDWSELTGGQVRL